jgi:hypothetical protein
MLKEFALVPALVFGLSIAASAAEAPAAPSAIAPAKAAIPKSDRWFSIGAGGEKQDGYMHITIKPSGDADAPVRVAHEYKVLRENSTVGVELDSHCLNDEWLSPVKMSMALHEGDSDSGTFQATITRPNPKSTAGKMVLIMPSSNQKAEKGEVGVKERTVLLFALLELASRFPFEKDKSFDFVTFDFLEGAKDRTLTYKGEEEVEVKGQKRKLHKSAMMIRERDFQDEFWLTDKHELVRAQINGAVFTPASETEARKPLADWEAKQAGPGNNERMSECVAGCGTIRTAIRIYFAQHNAYPTLDGVTGDQLEVTLHLVPNDLDGKYFKPGSYLVNSTPRGYTIKATLGAQTYVIDEKGFESGTYRTDQ